jgi:hypothetical protein
MPVRKWVVARLLPGVVTSTPLTWQRKHPVVAALALLLKMHLKSLCALVLVVLSERVFPLVVTPFEIPEMSLPPLGHQRLFVGMHRMPPLLVRL